MIEIFRIIRLIITCSICSTAFLNKNETVIVFFGGILAGLGVGWLGPVSNLLKDGQAPVLDQLISAEEEKMLNLYTYVTIAVATLIVLFLVDAIGRYICIFLGNLLKLTACLIFIFAKDFTLILIGRIFDASSLAVAFLVLPMYIAEIVGTNLRGTKVSSITISILIGAWLMYIFGNLMPYDVLHKVYAVFVGLWFIPIIFLRESPYFLFSKGKIEATANVLTELRGSEEAAKEEFIMYAQSLINTTTSKMKVITDNIFLKTASKVVFLSILGQLAGFMFIHRHLETILNITKLELFTTQPVMFLVTLGVIQMFASVCTTAGLYFFKRKSIIVNNLILSIIGMGILGTFFRIQSIANASMVLRVLPFVGIAFAVFGYIGAYTTLFFVVLPELFDGRSRALGVSIGIISVTVTTCVISEFFDEIPSDIGFWAFGGACAILMFAVMYLLPETKGKTFQDIQLDLGRTIYRIELN